MGFWQSLFSWGGIIPPVSADARFVNLNSPEVLEILRGGGGDTWSGKRVTERSALSNATFFRAYSLIIGVMGMLPLGLYQTKNDQWSVATDHPTHKLFKVKPNGWQTPVEFKSYMQGRMLLKGNAYALKVVNGKGQVVALRPIDPDHVSVKQLDNGELEYIYEPKRGHKRPLKRTEIFHLRAPMSTNGITGLGLLSVAADALALAEVMDEAAARQMRNGSLVGGVLKHVKSLTKEAIESLRDQWAERYSGPENSGRWPILEEGMDAVPFHTTGRDAQGLEQRRHQAEEISRFTGVPRPLLMFDETSWGTGIQQLGLFLVTYCLLTWFVIWEEAINLQLLTDTDRETHRAKFNEAALLRGSLTEQAEFFAKALGGPGATGFMLPNEAREKMNMNRLAGDAGDKPGWVTEGSVP